MNTPFPKLENLIFIYKIKIFMQRGKNINIYKKEGLVKEIKVGEVHACLHY